MSQISQNIKQLNAMIQKGEIMQAMNRFYAEDTVMGENDQPPTEGLAANLAREQEFVDNTEWYAAELLDEVVEGDVSMSRWKLDFHNQLYGNRLRFTQVSVAKWRDNKIVDERYYYSPEVVD